ncbi:MAG: inositol monophosphatase family protein, partial [Acidimicrobiia bacterium]
SAVGSKSSPTDMVTEMDRAAEDLIVRRLRESRPDDGLIGEEGTSVASRSGVTWVIDPLDGTTNYLYRLPAFSVSIAAETEGGVVAGVVHNPVLAETYAAAAGEGATLNGSPLVIGEAPEMTSALVSTGFGYDPNRRREQAEVVARLIASVRDIRRFGSAALDLCSVASGRSDIYFEQGCQRWDMAAGALVAREAGAAVGSLEGEGWPTTEMAIAAHPALFEQFRELLIRSRR